MKPRLRVADQTGSVRGSMPRISHTRSATATSVCAHGSHDEPQQLGHWLRGIPKSGRTDAR